MENLLLRYHFTHVYQKSQSYDIRFLSETDKIFCHFGPFLHFHPTSNPKNQDFKKLKKIPADMITLHMCTRNDNHMIYGS